MTDFKAKMHQIRFQLGSAPDPLAGFGGPTSKETEREGRGGEGRRGKEREGRGGKGRGGKKRAMSPPTIWRKFTPMSPRRSFVHLLGEGSGGVVGEGKEKGKGRDKVQRGD